MASRRPSRPALYTPESLVALQEAIGDDVSSRMRSERLTPTQTCARYHGVNSDVWGDIYNGNATTHGIDRLLRAAAAMGMHYELVPVGGAA